MLIPSTTTAGNYGTTSTLASTATTAEFTPVTSGVNGTGITVTGDPAFSVKKLLALPTGGNGTACPTDNSVYASTLSNVVPGSEVCVHLAYQNKTSGAVTNAGITDTLSSGFNYVSGSTSNCLTPSVGNQVCASDPTMAGTNWTGDNGWTGSSFALSPHSGFYGQSATASTATMEMGKKRYIDQKACFYIGTNEVNTSVRFNNGVNTYGDDTTATNSATKNQNCAPAGNGGWVANTVNNNQIQAKPNLDGLGLRFFNVKACFYINNITGDETEVRVRFNNGVNTYGDDPVFSNSQINSQNCAPAGNGGWVANTVNNNQIQAKPS